MKKHFLAEKDVKREENVLSDYFFPGSSSSGNRSDTAGAPTNPESRRKGLRRIGKGVVGSAMSEVKEMVNSIDRR